MLLLIPFCTKLLFASAEVKFHLAAGMESGFIIVNSEKSDNLVFFEEDIILRCTSELQTSIMQTNGNQVIYIV